MYLCVNNLDSPEQICAHSTTVPKTVETVSRQPARVFSTHIPYHMLLFLRINFDAMYQVLPLIPRGDLPIQSKIPYI